MESKVAAVGVATAVSAETQVAVSDIVNYLTGASGEGLIVRGVINITPGAGTTAIVVRVRRGNGLGGAVIGTAQSHTLAAAASGNIPFEVLDATAPQNPVSTPSGAQPAPASQYTVSVQQTGGTGAGTVNYATLGITPAATGW